MSEVKTVDLNKLLPWCVAGAGVLAFVFTFAQNIGAQRNQVQSFERQFEIVNANIDRMETRIMRLFDESKDRENTAIRRLEREIEEINRRLDEAKPGQGIPPKKH